MMVGASQLACTSKNEIAPASPPPRKLPIGPKKISVMGMTIRQVSSGFAIKRITFGVTFSTKRST